MGTLTLRGIGKNIYLKLYGFLAWVAVSLRIAWPQAYRLIGYSYLNQYKMLILNPRRNPHKIREVQQKAVFYLEKYVSFVPSLNRISRWIDAHFRLSSVFLSIPEASSIDHASQVARRVEEFRRNIPVRYKIPESDIAFVPRPLAEGSLGVYENLESYLKAMALGLVPARRLFFLVDPKLKVNNPCYLEYWGRHVTVVRDEKQIRSLTPQEEYLTVPMLGLFKQYGQRSLLMHAGLGFVREQWIREKRQPLLILSNEDKKRGWDMLASKGIPQGAWFVGLHVREPGWRDNNADVENARNAKIETYFTAIKSITDAGGWVIRLGDPLSMTPLPVMERVIDYAHSELKSDWMDVFLSSQCRFLIGTGSGVYTVSEAFGIPCVMTNLMPTNNMFALTSRDIFLPKKCKSKEEGRYLTFQEIVIPPVGVAIHAYKDMGLELEDNTEDEIKGAVDEMLAYHKGVMVYSPEDESLQADFKSMVNDCAPLYGDSGIELYARIGRDYLKKHAFLLPVRQFQ